MSRSCLALGLLLAGGSAFASGPYPGYGGPGPCGGYITRHWVVQPPIDTVVVIPNVPGGSGSVSGGGVSGGAHGATPVGSSGPSTGVPNLGSGKGEALLIMAVLAAAALPVVVYVVDAPASEHITQCWAVPNQNIQLYGGALSASAGSGGYFGVRGGASIAFVGFDLSAEGGAFGYRNLSAAFALRAVPKQHIDLALAVGVRQLWDAGGIGNWVEISLPHRYLPFRQDPLNPGFGIDVRPALLLGSNAIDARLDAALVIPFGPWASLDLGARAWSFQSSVRFGALAGFRFNL